MRSSSIEVIFNLGGLASLTFFLFYISLYFLVLSLVHFIISFFISFFFTAFKAENIGKLLKFAKNSPQKSIFLQLIFRIC